MIVTLELVVCVLKFKRIWGFLQELGADQQQSESDEELSRADSGFSYADDDTCGCTIWDAHSHTEHLEAFHYAARCSGECSLDKVRQLQITIAAYTDFNCW